LGTLGIVARLFGLVLVVLVSYFLCLLLVSFGGSAPELLGISPDTTSAAAQTAQDALTVVVTLIVGVMFTIPLSLSMFGHALAWVRHVAARSARFLFFALVLAFALDFAGAGAGGVGGLSSGIALVLVFVALGAMLLALATPTTLLGVASEVFDAAVGVGRFRRAKSSRVASVELRVTPTRQVRSKEKPERIREEAIRFQRLIQALSMLGNRTEFRLSFREGRGRILLLSRGNMSHDELQERLLATVRAHLPEFRPEPSKGAPEESSPQYSVCVTGVPEAAENPLEPLSRFFLENNYSGDYRVILEKTAVNPFRRSLSRARQRKVAKKASEQVTSDSVIQGKQRTTTVRDFVAEVELEEAVKLVDRHQSSAALKCWVYVTAYARSKEATRGVAEGAASVLVGSLSSHRSASSLKTSHVAGEVDGFGRGRKHALLLPSEAVPYAWIPQVALGTEIAPSAEFELPPQLDGEIELGGIVVHSSPTSHEARVPVDSLVKHCFITGMTGTGKTTSCFSLLLQLHRLGVPFLVVEPVKNEYRSLLAHIDGLQVFTLGDEDTAPFRLNIFEPPRDVKVQTHLENLEAAWNASFVMYAPLPYVVKEVLAETYAACGWDVTKNKRGRPITLEDFRVQSEKVSRRLGYEPKVVMDIEAALKTRITSLSLGGKGPMFNTVASTPIDDLLRRPTVIELKDIQNNEEKAFVAALLLMDIVEHIERKGSSKQLRHLTLIEEAHRLLPNISSQKGDPEGADPRKRMVEQFANMLAEVRAYGEGLAIVEQIPTKIIPDAIKNTATKIAHRVPAADDREVLAGAMNLTKAQAGVFTALKPGEAIVSLERHPLPIRVQAPNVIDRIGLPLGEIGDEEVKRHMVEFYLRNPLPPAPAKVLNDTILPLVDSDWFKERFIKAYRTWLAKGEVEPLGSLVVQAARKYSGDEEDVMGVASKILTLAVGFYLPFDDQDRIKFPRLFMQEVRRSMRDGRRR
jgi:uncharacterized protein DUF87